MSHDDVVDLVASWATLNTGVTSAQYYEGMNTSTVVGNQASVDTRNTWKYCAINGAFSPPTIYVPSFPYFIDFNAYFLFQGMFQTPLYRVDGLLIGGLKTMDDWKATLEPLVV
jgi:hypothetical protein